jgi:hypothetical protein
MPTVRLGAVFGALCLLGSCVPVDSDPPVSGSKQIQQLSGHEIVYLCDWATDYMGGALSNPDSPEGGDGIYHRCPGDIGVPEGEARYAYFKYEECPTNLAAEAAKGCTLTVNDFTSWIEAIGDTPCDYHVASNGQCELIWEDDEGDGQ